MSEPTRPAYLTEVLYKVIDKILGESQEVELSVDKLRKALRRALRKLPWKQRRSPAYKAVRRSVRPVRVTDRKKDEELEYTANEVIDHYTKQKWNVTFHRRKESDPKAQSSFFQFTKKGK